MQSLYTEVLAASLHEGHHLGLSLLTCKMGWCVLVLEPGSPVTSHCVTLPMPGKVPGKRKEGQGAEAMDYIQEQSHVSPPQDSRGGVPQVNTHVDSQS